MQIGRLVPEIQRVEGSFCKTIENKANLSFYLDKSQISICKFQLILLDHITYVVAIGWCYLKTMDFQSWLTSIAPCTLWPSSFTCTFDIEVSSSTCWRVGQYLDICPTNTCSIAYINRNIELRGYEMGIPFDQLRLNMPLWNQFWSRQGQKTSEGV